MSNDANSGTAVLQWLKERHAQILRKENEAQNALHVGDIDSYREKMREKAKVLAEIYKDSADILCKLPLPGRDDLVQALKSFSQGAQTALDLDSVFYMSALLYPDDHKPGEPDNLARNIEKFRAAIQLGK